MTKFRALLSGVAAGALMIPMHAMAAVVTSGGVDPVTGLTTFLTYSMNGLGVAVPTICAFKGAHAVAQGQHLMPHVAHAIGGGALGFGGAYLLRAYGA